MFQLKYISTAVQYWKYVSTENIFQLNICFNWNILTENMFQLKICFNRHHHNASFSQGAIIGETTQAPADGKEIKSGQQINFLDSLKR